MYSTTSWLLGDTNTAYSSPSRLLDIMRLGSRRLIGLHTPTPEKIEPRLPPTIMAARSKKPGAWSNLWTSTPKRRPKRPTTPCQRSSRKPKEDTKPKGKKKGNARGVQKKLKDKDDAKKKKDASEGEESSEESAAEEQPKTDDFTIIYADVSSTKIRSARVPVQGL